MLDSLKQELKKRKEEKHQKRLANKDQKITQGINAQTEIVKYSADHWKRLG